mmetsp:Transcript_48990/g.43910  ORF Transcript_48990/g.43910 Transcript_48990/m.43910 type:complete len:406 (-) Transcript_48990:91-1308(-)
MELFIKSADKGTSSMIIIDPNSTIKELKDAISNSLNIPISSFSVHIGASNLKPLHRLDLTLMDYNIQSHSTINLKYTIKIESYHNSGTIKSPKSKSKPIIISYQNESIYLENMSITCTIQEIKECIHSQTKIPMEKQILSFIDNRPLSKTYNTRIYLNNHQMKLCEYKIPALCNIYLNVKTWFYSFDNLLSQQLLTEINLNLMDNQEQFYSYFTSIQNKIDIEEIRMYRVNNKVQFKRYQTDKIMGMNKTECTLYHGASFRNIENIVNNGFVYDQCDDNKEDAGGIYFGKHPQNVAKYCVQDENGYCGLVSCKVMVPNGRKMKKKNISIDRDWCIMPVYVFVFKRSKSTKKKFIKEDKGVLPCNIKNIQKEMMKKKKETEKTLTYLKQKGNQMFGSMMNLNYSSK